MNDAKTSGKLPAEPLTPDEVASLMDACGRRSPTGRRNRALIALLYRSGLRVSEALALRPGDVDLDAGSVRVLNGKGAKARTAWLLDGAHDHIELWLAARKAKGINGHAPLFCTLAGGAVLPSYVRAMFKRLSGRADQPKRVHAHGLRHSHAVLLAMNGVPMHAIQDQLGHSHLSTTQTYVSHLAATDVRDAVRAVSRRMADA